MEISSPRLPQPSTHTISRIFPLGLFSRSQLHSEPYNHSSANNFPEDVAHYLQTEVDHKAIWGPHVTPPITLHTSPFLSRPKPDNAHRRMIIDLSWPKGAIVNSATCTNIHVNAACALSYPTIDNMVDAAVQANYSDKCCLFKVDLERAFRNLRIDLNDYDLILGPSILPGLWGPVWGKVGQFFLSGHN